MSKIMLVEDDNNPVPVASVRERFERWVAAAGFSPDAGYLAAARSRRELRHLRRRRAGLTGPGGKVVA